MHAYVRTKELQRGVIEEASLKKIAVGDLVAVEYKNYRDELPLIAEILKINSDSFGNRVVHRRMENRVEACKGKKWSLGRIQSQEKA